ncbi:ARM repeat-containing protein [Desarmillaria tabescens]|uniref:MMS19 nucleotide excision repair protein n=1 Tax=Armillaria tabescens TaxID=1929756 RepID=A0AA39NKB5_ARMTA|nr:ARM repeat-containing protein [Desarmillaria tabescens]KAK0467221.1 ARM repeat-containing protein [Desarmillaria tabescens]
MESTERLVHTWMASGRDEEVAATVSEYLTSEEDNLRTKGVEFLSLVLDRCPPEKLNRQSVRVLVTFYCSKLEDTETIIPALKGLLSLSRLNNCTNEDVPVIIKALFTYVRMKVLVQSVRLVVYSIIDNFMARHRDALKRMNKEFLVGYITLADGEKDPRNLLVAFAIARVILVEFDISDFVEGFFNITFCYFPITFRPPPNDPYGISADDLKRNLRRCLSATPAFGPMAIPVFLEKLTAGSPMTKRDTLQSMSECFPVYGAGLARSSAREIWNALKLEIFQPTDTITADMALSCTQSLVKTIYSADSKAEDDSKTDIEGLAQDACEECIKILREPEKSQARPAIKVLCAFMSTTPSVARYTISKTAPHLVTLFVTLEETTSRLSDLLLLSDLIAAARDSVSNLQQSEVTEPPLLLYKDEVLGIVTTGLQTSSLRRPALACLLGMVSTKNLLTDEELGFVVHKTNEVLQGNSDENEDESDTLKLLTTITTISPHHVVDQTLPLLFNDLPDRPPSRDAVADRIKYRRVLTALSTLCQQPELFEVFMIRLTTRVELLCSSTDIEADLEPRAAYAHAILKSIAQTMSSKVDERHVDVPKYIDRLVPRLFNLFIYSALNSDGGYVIATDPRLILVAGDIISLVTQCLTVEKYQIFMAVVFSAFLSGNVAGICEGQPKLPVDVVIHPFQESASTPIKNLILLFAAATDILKWSLTTADNDIQREAAWKILASILNKHTAGKVYVVNRRADASGFLTQQLETFAPNRLFRYSLDSVAAWVHICKALLVQSHPLTLDFSDRLFGVFGDESIGWDAAKAIGQVVEPGDVLSKSNHAVIKILHVQRFVSKILPRIITGANDASKPDEQISNLVALASLIKSISKSLYSQQMPTLIPLLLRGLDLPDESTHVNVIDTFIAAAEGDTPEQSLVAEHVPSLISKMLKNSRIQDMPSMRVRIAATRYLAILPQIVRYDILHPYKSQVVKELVKVLDDSKRAVRKEAVDAR